MSPVEIGVEASFLFLSHLAVCVMFICSYTVCALLPDSRAAPKQGAYISRGGALLAASTLNVKGCMECSSISLEISFGLISCSYDGSDCLEHASFFQFCIVQPILHAACEHIQVKVLVHAEWR